MESVMSGLLRMVCFMKMKITCRNSVEMYLGDIFQKGDIVFVVNIKNFQM